MYRMRSELDLFWLAKQNAYVGAAINYVTANNTSNFNPYHNLKHSLFVPRMAWSLYEDDTPIPFQPDIIKLIIAGLFHDFNHPGQMGNRPDIENIKDALEGFNKFALSINLDKDTVDGVIALITATEFPHSNSTVSLAGYLRDADLLQSVDHCSFEHVVCGIAKESNKTVKTVLNEQSGFLEFLENKGLTTAAGKKTFEDNKKPMLLLLQTIQDSIRA